MTELVPSEAAPGPEATSGQSSRGRETAHGRAGTTAAMLAALGIVYGDIGTSPLYAVQTVFSIDGGVVKPTSADVFGVVSLIFWSITLIVSVKYVIFILRADNDGEGGVMALAALVRRLLDGSSRRRLALVMGLGVLGASLFYGDSVITPAISVLSAVEGLEVVSPGLHSAVVPIAAVILAALFAVQRWGTARVGTFFGPVMLVWFASLGVAGLKEVVGRPGILRGLSPGYAFAFIADRPYTAFIAMGAVVLSITGAEALYADMGHFGRGPIRRAWFWIVFPALTLNYLAQGALILRDPSARSSPFFLLMPHWAQIPMVVLATAATIIASQAVISGAFSVSRQAVRLGFLPHMRIRHTSESQEGQVFVPAVNAALFAAVILLVLTFRSSTRLATAYGVAVTGTFLITTALFLAVARALWRWPVWRLVLVGVVFGVVELTYFAANLTKVTHGGWLTLLIAALVFTVMMTWQKGRGIVTARRRDLEGPLPEFIRKVHSRKLPRVPGVAVFPHPTKETTPLALRANLEHNHVLHEHVLILSGSTANVPHIPWERRISVDHLGDPADGIVHIAAEFGFQDRNDFPEVLRRVSAEDAEGLPPDLDPGQVSFFLSRITLRRTRRPGMSTWRKQLFIVMAHNAASQAEFLHLPDDR
ncbi:MAG: potassium transporter Kup, partial [Frankiales bacterium]|nr:potassium transporter Kup [Frankiales bacterium]